MKLVPRKQTFSLCALKYIKIVGGKSGKKEASGGLWGSRNEKKGSRIVTEEARW